MSAMPPPTVPPTTPPPPGGSYTPPKPAGRAPGGSDRTIWLVLSYLGILSLIPYFAKKDDPDAEIRWHARNGVALFLAELVVGAIFFAVGLAMRDSVAGCGLGIIECVIWLGFLVVSIICIVKAVGGQRFRIPVVTDFSEKL